MDVIDKDDKDRLLEWEKDERVIQWNKDFNIWENNNEQKRENEGQSLEMPSLSKLRNNCSSFLRVIEMKIRKFESLIESS